MLMANQVGAVRPCVPCARRLVVVLRRALYFANAVDQLPNYAGLLQEGSGETPAVSDAQAAQSIFPEPPP